MGRPVATLRRTVGREIDTAERLAEIRSMVYASRVEENPPPSLGRGLLTAAALMLISRPASEAISSSEDPQIDRAVSLANPQDELVSAIDTTLPEVEDRRFIGSEGYSSPLRRVDGRVLRGISAQKGAVSLPSAIKVPAEASVIMCIRRKTRRGVLLALGQGGGFHKKPRRGLTSNIWC